MSLSLWQMDPSKNEILLYHIHNFSCSSTHMGIKFTNYLQGTINPLCNLNYINKHMKNPQKPMNPMYVYRLVYLSLSHCIIYSSLSKSCSSWHLEHQEYVAPIVVIVGRFWSSFHLVLALVIMWVNNVLWAFIVERATKTYNQYWYPTVLAPQNVNKLCISCSF